MLCQRSRRPLCAIMPGFTSPVVSSTGGGGRAPMRSRSPPPPASRSYTTTRAPPPAQHAREACCPRLSMSFCASNASSRVRKQAELLWHRRCCHCTRAW